MPAVAKDGMRGLAVFISDIRNCKSKEAETKRINKVKRVFLSAQNEFVFQGISKYSWKVQG